MSDEIYLALVMWLSMVRWSGRVSFNFLNEPLLDETLTGRVKLLHDYVPWAEPVVFTNGDLILERGSELLSAGVFKFVITEHPPYTAEWQEKMREARGRFDNRLFFRDRLEYSGWLNNAGGSVFPPSARPRKFCNSLSCAVQVLINGDVNLCCCDPSRNYIQGNIMEFGLYHIWEHSRVLDVRRAAFNGEPITQTCQMCLSGKGVAEVVKDA